MTCDAVRSSLSSITHDIALMREEFATLQKGDLDTSRRLIDKSKEIRARMTALSESFTPKFLKEALEDSKAFYNSHNLTSFADLLPKRLRLSPESRRRIKEAQEQGFDRMICMVPYETQAKNLAPLIQEMATKPLKGLSDKEQYTDPYVSEDVKNNSILHDSSKGIRNHPYLLLYSSGPIDQNTKNKTFPECEQILKAKNLNGLTLPEYLLLQRREAESNKNHSFDAWSDDPTKSNWSWLLDSRVPSGCVRALWVPRFLRVDLYWHGSGRRDSDLGARPGVVVKI